MGDTCDMFDWEENTSVEEKKEERKNVVVNCATCKVVAEIVNELEVKRNSKMKTKYVKEKKKVKLMSLMLIFSWIFFVWYVSK
jgi:hypothetical protein